MEVNFMSFSIVIKDNTGCLAASFYSQYFFLEHYQIVGEVIEIINRYNEMMNKYKDKTELALNILNTRKNMESCGYSHAIYSPSLDKNCEELVKTKYSDFKIANPWDYRYISIDKNSIKSYLENSSYEIEIDISKNKVMLNIYKETDELSLIKDMANEEDFTLDDVPYCCYNFLDLYMYELEDVKNYLKKLSYNVLKKYKSDIYYVSGKLDFIKILL
jgi:hypothetical protein